MTYLVARATGFDNREVFQPLGSATSRVQPEYTQFTGLVDADGNPIHRMASHRPKMGFHSTR